MRFGPKCASITKKELGNSPGKMVYWNINTKRIQENLISEPLRHCGTFSLNY